MPIWNGVVRSITWTYLSQIIKQDPDWHNDSKLQREYEFSNGRVFEGRYQERGPYADD